MAINIRCIQVYLLEIFLGAFGNRSQRSPWCAEVSRWTALGSATRGKSRSLPTRSESSIATLGMTQGRARGRRAGGSEQAAEKVAGAVTGEGLAASKKTCADTMSSRVACSVTFRRINGYRRIIRCAGYAG